MRSDILTQIFLSIKEVGRQWSRFLLFLLVAFLRFNSDGISVFVLECTAGQQLTPRSEGAGLHLLLLHVGPVLRQRQLLDGSHVLVGLAVALLGLLQVLVGPLLVLEDRLLLRGEFMGRSQLGHGAENQPSVQVGEGVVGGDDGSRVPGTYGEWFFFNNSDF